MAGGAVLVHDVAEEQEGVAVVDAGGVILSVDEQQHYVALADGPGDVEAYYGLGSGSEEKSSDDWGSVGVIGKNGRRALLLLALGWLAALVFVGMRSFGWQKVWSGSNGTAIALKDPPLGPGDPGVPIPYPKTLTAYHCRPAKNWISDPCGPMYYKGYYHIFYQYNPGKAVWGNITWGHGVSKDMVQWTFLHPALAPKEWYDIKGTWSGSVTIRPDGLPLIYYTGSSAADEQMASIAEPKDPSDPLLREWVKYTRNPILRPPPAILIRDFRDPTTAWMGADGVYRLAVGSKIGRAGVALMYKSKDLYNWEYQGEENLLHAVAGTGMWECVDFYPVGPLGEPTPPLGTHGPGVHHVLKVSLDDERHDWYALGFYDTEKDIFIPDNPIIDVGIGLRYNYGKFYASKSFIDPVKQRRIIWGFVNESDPEVYDLAKGWNTVMGIPRTVWYDNDTGINVIQLPIDEIDQLRGSKLTKKAVHLPPGSVVPVEGAIGDQLDIEVVFEYPNVSIVGESEKNLDEHFECGQGGAQARGTFGPFGLLLLADKNLTELSAVFFYISHVKNAGWTTRFCADPTRGSLAKGIDTTIYGSFVNVLESEDFLSARIFVDKSVIETFVQGGRMTVNMRAYPTIAYESNANVFFFNNGTSPIKVRSIDVWQMQAATMLNL